MLTLLSIPSVAHFEPRSADLTSTEARASRLGPQKSGPQRRAAQIAQILARLRARSGRVCNLASFATLLVHPVRRLPPPKVLTPSQAHLPWDFPDESAPSPRAMQAAPTLIRIRAKNALARPSRCRSHHMPDPRQARVTPDPRGASSASRYASCTESRPKLRQERPRQKATPNMDSYEHGPNLHNAKRRSLILGGPSPRGAADEVCELCSEARRVGCSKRAGMETSMPFDAHLSRAPLRQFDLEICHLQRDRPMATTLG